MHARQAQKAQQGMHMRRLLPKVHSLTTLWYEEQTTLCTQQTARCLLVCPLCLDLALAQTCTEMASLLLCVT